MSEIAIRVEKLSKRYRIGLEEKKHETLGEAIFAFFGRPLRNLHRLRRLSKFADNGSEREDIIWALKDISFEVKKGQVIGIIGRNGAGKTTLLKILSRITQPTNGEVLVRGRVGSLLEVGTGFHPELTGRENIYLNGTILGMKKADIDRRFDEIVDFSGVEKFLDTPVKRYSSGMRVRLAFAVAAHLEPHVLLVDEVLAVGDVEFQKKCLGKMESVTAEGRTVLFVSHNMSALQRLCPEAMLLDSGCLINQGESPRIVQEYLQSGTEEKGERKFNWSEEEKKTLEPFVPLALRLLDDKGVITERVKSTDPFYVEIEYQITQNVSNLKLGTTLSTGEGERFCVCWDDASYERKPGFYVSKCEVPGKLFSHGGFILGIISGMPGTQKTYRDFDLLRFYIDGGVEISQMGRSILRPDFEWQTECVSSDQTGLQ